MNIAIAGAKGFLGSQATTAFKNNHITTRAVPRFFTDPNHGAYIHCAEERLEKLAEFLSNYTYLISFIHSKHGSNARHPSHIGAASLAQSIEITTQLALGAALSNTIFIYISSGGAIYGSNATISTTEETQCKPVNLYGHSKLLNEQTLDYLHRTKSLSYISLRVSNAYGIGQAPRNGQGVIAYWLDSAIKKRPISITANPKTSKDYIFSQDICSALVKATKRFYATKEAIAITLNIGSGTSSSLEEIIDTLRQYLPSLEVSKDYNEGNISDIYEVSSLNNSKAKKILDWSPEFNLELGIPLTLDWHRNLCT